VSALYSGTRDKVSSASHHLFLFTLPGVRRSKVKVTGGRSKIWRREGNIVLDSLGGVDFLVLSQYLLYTVSFLSASHYVSKRGAY